MSFDDEIKTQQMARSSASFKLVGSTDSIPIPDQEWMVIPPILAAAIPGKRHIICCSDY